MYSSFLLLAIPLFILAAEFMNSGAIMERLLTFCNALVGRFRGGMAQVNVVQSVIFSAMSGSALADAASSGKIMQTLMTKDGRYPPAFAAALTAASAVHGAGDPAVDPAGGVRAHLRYLHRLSAHRRHHSGHCSSASRR